jgi:pimeloyl-ACP methyl ester carboxylesterase
MGRIPGIAYRDHTLTAPLDHREPGGPTIEVFAREVTAPDKAEADLPWLVFLQGGPGGEGPRPTDASGWLGAAIKTHRVLLLDQRGTGRSTPLNARTVAGKDTRALADYLRHFRADSIVADAELFRDRLGSGKPWETLGQSYGGFITLTYLSRAPQGLRGCYITGGVPGLTATAEKVYELTYPRVEAKNREYYTRYPEDVALVRRIADHVDENDVRLPDGDRLTARRLQVLGLAFGMSDGYERVHWMLEMAFHGSQLSDTFRYGVMATTGFIDNPLYALQEYVYGQGAPTAWAAERARVNLPQFAQTATPLMFTGEMMYPWMFQEIAALRPFAAVAGLLADADDWPPLYDAERLRRNEVPVAAAVYYDDMYVDAHLQLETLHAVGNTRAWVTNEYEHNGLRADGGRVLGRLMDMVAGRV